MGQCSTPETGSTPWIVPGPSARSQCNTDLRKAAMQGPCAPRILSGSAAPNKALRIPPPIFSGESSMRTSSHTCRHNCGLPLVCELSSQVFPNVDFWSAADGRQVQGSPLLRLRPPRIDPTPRFRSFGFALTATRCLIRTAFSLRSQFAITGYLSLVAAFVQQPPQDEPPLNSPQDGALHPPPLRPSEQVASGL